jgi:fructokinase
VERVSTLCLGEALVDLVCEQPVAGLADAAAFVPHPGGATANVAVAAARAGADVALAGGAGDDAWGAWLRDRLASEGVELEHFHLRAGQRTAVAFVTADADGEPSYAIYGEGIEAAVAALGEEAERAAAAAGAFFFASNTLVGEPERAITLAARRAAQHAGRPVVFDPNLRLHRWRDPQVAAEIAGACVEDAFLVKCNAKEAQLITGCAEPTDAAGALLARGARHAIVTIGAAGAVLAGPAGVRHRADGVAADVVCTTGAGDAVAGVLLAMLGAAEFDPSVLPAALDAAMVAGARATESWGALG